MFVLYFSCYIFRVILKGVHILWQLLLLYVWQIFCQTIRDKLLSVNGQVGPIHYLAIFLCLFWNYLSVDKLNCLLFFWMVLLIFSLHKWYCPIRFSIAFHSHCCYIIKFISIIHNIHSPSPVLLQVHQIFKCIWWVCFLNWVYNIK